MFGAFFDQLEYRVLQMSPDQNFLEIADLQAMNQMHLQQLWGHFEMPHIPMRRGGVNDDCIFLQGQE